MHIQPSEFVKIILPAYFIQQCSVDTSIFEKFSSFVRLLGKVFIPVALIALEPNNGTAGVIALMIGVLTLIMGIPCRFWVVPLCAIAVGLVVFAVGSSHVQKRLVTYLHPEADLKGKGHQPYQAKIAAGSGGLLGRGPAKSMQKLSYLPEAQNDYIAAIFAEEFGFLGIATLLSVYAWLLYEVMRIVSTTESMEAFCWGMSIFYLLSFQTFMNLGVVSGLLPSTGLNLPFFSQGGSSLVANFLGIGLIITMVSSQKTRVPV
jgi:cell division protein FtsW